VVDYQFIEEKQYGWREYMGGAGYEVHTVESEVWAWKSGKDAARDLAVKLVNYAHEQGTVPLWTKSYYSTKGLLYDNIKVEMAVGRKYAEAAPLGPSEVYSAIAPILIYVGVVASIAIIEWLRPGTISDAVSWFVKEVGDPLLGPVLKPLIAPALALLGAYVVFQVVK